MKTLHFPKLPALLQHHARTLTSSRQNERIVGPRNNCYIARIQFIHQAGRKALGPSGFLKILLLRPRQGAKVNNEKFKLPSFRSLIAVLLNHGAMAEANVDSSSLPRDDHIAELKQLEAWCPLDHTLTGLDLGYCDKEKVVDEDKTHYCRPRSTCTQGIVWYQQGARVRSL